MSNNTSHPLSTLAHNLIAVAASQVRDERAADATVNTLLSTIAREWREIVRHPLFAQYGGTDTAVRRVAYTARRIANTRQSLVQSLHVPSMRALDGALEAVEIEMPA